jgi:hypothetical protein
MSCKEVVTFWLDTGAPISLLLAETDADRGPLDFRTRGQAMLVPRGRS